MDFDIELYRRSVTVSNDPPVRLSVIDVCPERPAGTIVMVHGYGGNARHWKYLLYALADTNRCIAIDQRGHGQSDKPNSAYTMDEIVADIDAVMQALGVEEPCVLMGHSFGGALVTTFAHRYPERVARLVLIATADRFELPFYNKAALRLPTPVLNVLQPFVRRQLSAPPFVLKRFAANALSRWNGRGMLRALTLPVLVIRGDRDFVFPQANYAEVARLVPRAEEINVGVSRHMVLLERSEAVERAIERFLGQGHASWRSSDQAGERHEQLLSERPWLKVYDEGVPFTISVPDRPVYTLLDSAARRFANRPATVFMGRTLTYRQVERHANRLANALRSMGVDSGVRVMLLMPNCPQWVIAYYAVLKAGGVVVSTSPIAPPEEVIREVRDSGASFLVTLTALADRARAALDAADLQHVIYTHITDYAGTMQRTLFSLSREAAQTHHGPVELRPAERRWVELMKDYQANQPEVQVAPHSPALIQYTGGTTDEPKGVVLSHRALVANAFQTRHWVPGLKEGSERMLCVVPFAHAYGMTAGMNSAIALGAAMVILPRFVTGEVLRTIKRYRPSLFPGVPTMYVAINNYPGVRRFNIRSVKACISGAAPLPVEVQEAFERLTKGRIVEGYGLTEAAPVTHANPLIGARRTGTIGVPLPNTEARVVSLTTGDELPPGQVGELIIRGPQIMDGYWDQPDETARTLHDGWLFTGDVARMDAQGYFQIISRKKDMWTFRSADRKPELAFPRDVEEVIYELPEVNEAAVVGVKDFPVAFVTINRPVAPGTIAEYCARRLPQELVPALVVIVDEMPKSFVGKIIRRALLEHIPEHQRRELDIVSDRIDEMLDYPSRQSDEPGR